MHFLRAFLCLLLAVASLRAEPTPALDREALLAQLVDDLAAHYALSESLEVDFVRPWTAPEQPAGASPVVATIVEYPKTLASSMLVRVRYSRDDRAVGEDMLALRVSLWRDSVVATTPLKRGDIVTLQGVTVRRSDALRERDVLPVSAVGDEYVVAREIPAGRALLWRDVIRRPLVRRGQMVEVQASDGTMVITIKAQALQDGARGDVVRLRNLESKRDFGAQVTAENRAEVRF